MMIILRQAETYSAANYSESSGDRLQTTAILFIALNTLFVTLRYYARRITKTVLGWDDFFISAGYISNVGLCITAIRTQSPNFAAFLDNAGLTSQFSDCSSWWCRTPYGRG